MTDIRRHIPKLEAMHARFSKLLVSGNGLPAICADPQLVGELAAMWSRVRDQLRQTDVLADLAVRAAPIVRQTTDFQGRGLVAINDVRVILDDVEYALDVLRRLPADEAPIEFTRQGFFQAGQPFDAKHAIATIVNEATSSIFLVDGYIGPATLNLLADKRSTVTVRILTYTKGKHKASTSDQLRQLACDFNVQHGGLAIRAIDEFHDRFLVVDDRDYFHFGSSFKDAGSRGFMYSLIEEPMIRATLQSELASAWERAERVIESDRGS